MPSDRLGSIDRSDHGAAFCRPPGCDATFCGAAAGGLDAERGGRGDCDCRPRFDEVRSVAVAERLFGIEAAFVADGVVDAVASGAAGVAGAGCGAGTNERSASRAIRSGTTR